MTSTTDFIAMLKYRTTAEGGRKTPASSLYRPQIKFEFSEMRTSGQQRFLDKEIVFLGIYMPPTMSSTCEHSITMFALNNIAYMHLGYPGWIQTPTTAGIDDQRNNPYLLAALKAQGKLQ